MTRQEAKTYLGTTNIALHELPQLNGQKIEGIFEGKMVAYWPTRDQAFGDGSSGQREAGLWRPIGVGGYIPAMIVSAWNSEPTEGPMVNLSLFLDPSNHETALREGLIGVGSCRYSEVPAQGCWTWIPKS